MKAGHSGVSPQVVQGSCLSCGFYKAFMIALDNVSRAISPSLSGHLSHGIGDWRISRSLISLRFMIVKLTQYRTQNAA